jgi:hypothetical protein
MWLLDIYPLHDDVRYQPFADINLCANRWFRSCGTFTTAPVLYQPSGKNVVPSCGKDQLKDTPNWCNTTPYVNSQGHADGLVTFIFTDCTTNKPLPMSYQNGAYAYPGVSIGPKM